ncbi:MAG: lysophospholipid acyltransferase family protein [Bacteroidaceae bacterium]|nr:lysophospholipid acyltransferase family protein [Bacteroidaceae bacterium]
MLYGFLYTFVYAFSLLPLCILYIISDGLYIIIYKIVGYRKKIVRKNLTDSFPNKTEEEIKKIEKGFYHFLADYFVETIKLMSISKKEISRRVKFSHTELLREAEDKGQSSSVFLGHYCNWEWVTSLGLQIQPSTYVCQIYHVMENRVFDKLFLHIRERMESKCVPMSNILRKRIECNREKCPMVIGYIADQVPFWNSIHYWTFFLNHDTPVLTGAETLAKRFNDRCLYLDIKRPRRGYYNLEFKLICKESKDIPNWEITETYYKELEKSINDQPEFWLWSHNRWKRSREKFIKKFGYDPVAEQNKNNK